MAKITILVVVMGSMVLVGCGTAQLVRNNAGGGRVALAGSYMLAMGEARMVMLEHCEGRFAYDEGPEAFDFTCAPPATERPFVADSVAAY